MAEYRTIKIGFWNDPYIEGLDAKAKLLYLYLFTGPYANNLGIVEATRRKIAYETALTQQEVDKYLAEFEAKGKVVCDPDHNLIFLTRFIRHQTSTSPKILEGLMKLTLSIPSPIIAKAVCVRYPHAYGIESYPSDTVSIPYADGEDTIPIPSGEFGKGSWKGKGKEEGEKGEPGGSPETPLLDPEIENFVREFQGEVKEEFAAKAPKVTDALVRKGAETVERLIRLDGNSLEEVRRVIAWARSDEFWREQVFSLAALRNRSPNGNTKFANIAVQYEKSGANRQSYPWDNAL